MEEEASAASGSTCKICYQYWVDCNPMHYNIFTWNSIDQVKVEYFVSVSIINENAILTYDILKT